MRLIIRWLITALALVIAAAIVPGIEIQQQDAWVTVLVMAAVFGLVNAFVRPILTLLSCPLILVTLGLFLLVINAVALMLASWISVNWLNQGFYVNGFWPALLGSIVVSVVSFVASLLLGDVGEDHA